MECGWAVPSTKAAVSLGNAEGQALSADDISIYRLGAFALHIG